MLDAAAIDFAPLAAGMDGTLHTDEGTRLLYATDASVYRRVPAAVALPRTVDDLRAVVRFAAARGLGVVPRTAGTSLAGQCVGDGIVVDVSVHFTRILDFDAEARTVTVEPGVIRDDLNRFLAPHGLWFSPNTATANRCMIGGMVGNNSSGSTSIRYGVTRDKVLALECVLADGSTARFAPLDRAGLAAKRAAPTREGAIYRELADILEDPAHRAAIHEGFPDARIERRNTGYALDALLAAGGFGGSPGEIAIDPCPLLAGSEGTLAFATAITLRLDALPPPRRCLVVAHYPSVAACLASVEALMRHRLYMCEMLDRTILGLTRRNPEQARNRELVVGDPAAVLLLELRDETEAALAAQAEALVAELDAGGASYAHPVYRGEAVDRVVELRKAGLGILGNLVGDAKAVACIEDTAVALPDLADYIAEFAGVMARYDSEPVYYAHAGAGELHLRPILNLKTGRGVELFREITDEVAALVRRYRGSMSGEHGDGIVRSGYIPLIVGEHNYALMRRVKAAFDPAGALNPGKIVDPYPMTERLRYEPDREEPDVPTVLDFSADGGILRLAEKCNGAGACRRTAASGGTMCPSYKATLRERDSTRGRANLLREVLTHPADAANRFDSEVLREALDLCLSCKGCAHECPSTVDVGAMKAEFAHHYQRAHGRTWRARAFAHNDRLNRLGRLVRPLTNAAFGFAPTAALLKRALGVAPQRSLPRLSRTSLRRWIARELPRRQPERPVSEVYFFVDEFTDQLDAHVGVAALTLLTRLGYRVRAVAGHAVSGRAFMSKGFLEEARAVAEANVATFHALASEEAPLVGVEPSALLMFRDEYPKLVRGEALRERSRTLAGHTLLVDEFLRREIDAGRVTPARFTDAEAHVKVHAHCHQRALADVPAMLHCLDLPRNYHVDLIPSGCCGMAGSFGYEAEHYAVSMAIGEQVLFPAVRAASAKTVLAAPGTSCRHQIADGAGRRALHPVEVLARALR